MSTSHHPDRAHSLDFKADDHDAHDDGLVHVHVHPTSLYLKVFGALIFFTLLTWFAASVHLGEWNFFVAVVIAAIKATLVALFFMHLKDDARFNGLLLIGSVIFMGVFFVYTINDTMHRGEWDEAYGTKVLQRTGERAPGGGMQDPIVVKDHIGHGGEHGGAAKGEHGGGAEH